MAARPPSIARALSSALKIGQTTTADLATVALARRYAAHLDAAAELEALAARTLEEARQNGDDATAAAVRRLEAAVQAQGVASDLGPKLLAALAALGMTPAARHAVTRGGEPTRDSRDPLDQLAQRRAGQRVTAPGD